MPPLPHNARDSSDRNAPLMMLAAVFQSSSPLRGVQALLLPGSLKRSAYDLNPNPHRPDRLSTAIDLDDTRADIETALSVNGYFRLTLPEARSEVSAVSEATSRWRGEAADLGLPRREIDLRAEAFETDQRRAASAIKR